MNNEELMQELNDADDFIFAVMKAREESIYRAVQDVHDVRLEHLRAAVGSPADVWDGFNEAMVSIIGDLSLCAQDAGVLVWHEVVSLIERFPGMHFCTPADCGEEE